ncbi:MAG: sigma-70 family RNA polymerase sigma factor [Candidatus Omnitrophota bacterium]
MEHDAYKRLETPLLVKRCVDKDPPAWAEFVRRFSGLIEFSIKKALGKYSHAGIGESVKDIRQNIFMSLWNNNKLAEITNRRNINYWLVITARNASVDYLRMQKKDVLIKDESYFEKLPARETIHKETLQNAENLERKIKSAYGFLAPKEKIIFKLYFKKSLKTREIAEILDISIGNVTSAVARIRKKIHRKI